MASVVGRTATVKVVPTSANSVTSTSDAAKSWKNSTVTDQSRSPPLQTRVVSAIEVSSSASALYSRVTWRTWSDRSTALMTTWASVKTTVAMKASYWIPILAMTGKDGPAPPAVYEMSHQSSV